MRNLVAVLVVLCAMFVSPSSEAKWKNPCRAGDTHYVSLCIHVDTKVVKNAEGRREYSYTTVYRKGKTLLRKFQGSVMDIQGDILLVRVTDHDGEMEVYKTHGYQIDWQKNTATLMY